MKPWDTRSEADFNRKGQSVFSDKMGQKICDSSISIVDDGTIRANRGACSYDDEGIPGQKTYMVRKVSSTPTCTTASAPDGTESPLPATEEGNHSDTTPFRA